MNTAPQSSLTQSTGDLAPGRVLDRYELLLPVAAGGMAMVWAARLKGSRGFQKIVAVKTMLPKLSEDEQFEQMFLDEAALASEIHHPHVVEILDLGEQQGILFLVMEWIDGVPLNQLMKAARPEGGVPIPVAVRIAMQACAGLNAAHELRNAEGNLVGLVHRDVSPQNIMVTHEGVAKVVDFGVAKATAMGGGATVAGQIKGKVAYMAPEQIKGAAIDRRVDIFALGIVLYALTTGKHPFRRESEAATMYNICAPQPVMPPRKVNPSYPPEVERIIIKSLAKDADKRYQTANEMLRDLDQLPSHLRASTDEEVAVFVRKLFGAKREERQQVLSEALLRADEMARTRMTAPALSPDVFRQTMQSTVSVVTNTGVLMGEVSGVGSAIGPNTAVNVVSARRRLVVLAAAAAAVLLALGIALPLALRGPDAAAVQAPSASVPMAPLPQVALPVAPAGATGAAGAASAMPSLSGPATSAQVISEGTAGARAKSANAPVQPAYKPAVLAPAATTGATPKAAAPTKPKWRHDPGF